MRASRFALLLLLPALIAGCATMVQPKNQKIQIVAVNGADPKCILSTPLHKYTAYPPQAINVERSRYVLVVECTANDGKSRRLLVPPEHNPTASYFQGPGLLVDKATGSAWNYPPYLRIDFDYEPFVDPIHPDGSPPATTQYSTGIPGGKLVPSKDYNE